MSKPYYCLLASSGPAILAGQAIAAAWGINAVWAPIAIHVGAGQTQTWFDASLPLPGPHILLGVDREMSFSEFSALAEAGLSIFDHPNVPGLLGYDERITAAPEEPVVEPEPEPKPEPDPMLYGYVAPPDEPGEDQPEA